MNKDEIKKLVKSNLLNCEHLSFIKLIFIGKGITGYVFKIDGLPIVLKLIPVDTIKNNTEYEITKYIYDLYETKHKINTIVKPYFSFICDTKKYKIKELIKSMVSKKLYDLASGKSYYFKKYTYIVAYEWINGQELVKHLEDNTINEDTLIKTLLSVFCTLKVLKDATNGSFLHNDLHIGNIMLKSNKQNIKFDYTFEKDNIVVSFRNKYIPILIDFNWSKIKGKFNDSRNDFTEYNDIFRFSNNLLWDKKSLLTDKKRVVKFLEYIVPEQYRHFRIIVDNNFIIDNFFILLSSKDMPFKKTIEEILLYPLFSDYVINKKI